MSCGCAYICASGLKEVCNEARKYGGGEDDCAKGLVCSDTCVRGELYIEFLSITKHLHSGKFDCKEHCVKVSGKRKRKPMKKVPTCM